MKKTVLIVLTIVILCVAGCSFDEGLLGETTNESVNDDSKKQTLPEIPDKQRMKNEKINEKDHEPKDYVQCIVEKANIRNLPSTDAEIIGRIKKNDRFEVISNDGTWTEIKYESKNGFIRNDLIENIVVQDGKRVVESYEIEKMEGLGKLQTFFCWIDDSMTKDELIDLAEKGGLNVYTSQEISDETGKETGLSYVFICRYPSRGNGYSAYDYYKFYSDNIMVSFSNEKLTGAGYRYYTGGKTFPYGYEIGYSPLGMRLHSLAESEPLYTYVISDTSSRLLGTNDPIEAFKYFDVIN